MAFAVVVECVIEFEKRFLLIRRPIGGHGEGLLCFVGGKVELSDGNDGANALVEAVKREVREEVGIELQEPISFLTSSTFMDSREVTAMSIVFHSRLEKKPQLVVDIREVPEYFWMSEAEIDESDAVPEWTRRYIGVAKTQYP